MQPVDLKGSKKRLSQNEKRNRQVLTEARQADRSQIRARKQSNGKGTA